MYALPCLAKMVSISSSSSVAQYKINSSLNWINIENSLKALRLLLTETITSAILDTKARRRNNSQGYPKKEPRVAQESNVNRHEEVAGEIAMSVMFCRRQTPSQWKCRLLLVSERHARMGGGTGSKDWQNSYVFPARLGQSINCVLSHWYQTRWELMLLAWGRRCSFVLWLGAN